MRGSEVHAPLFPMIHRTSSRALATGRLWESDHRHILNGRNGLKRTESREKSVASKAGHHVTSFFRVKISFSGLKMSKIRTSGLTNGHDFGIIIGVSIASPWFFSKGIFSI